MSLLLRLVIFPIVVFRRLLWPPLRRKMMYLLFLTKKLLRNSLVFFSLAALVLWYVTRPAPPPVQPGVLTEVDPTQNPAQATSLKPHTKITAIPEIKGAVEDGNSRFAHSLLEQMGGDDVALYSREFYRAMETAQPGVPHLWMGADASVFGKIEAEAGFTSKTGLRCRKFREVTYYHGRAQRFKGTGCQRAGQGQGWCRLRPESTPSCEIGYAPGFFEGLGSDIKHLTDWF